MNQRFLSWRFSAACAVLLSACGGGGTATPTPDAHVGPAIDASPGAADAAPDAPPSGGKPIDKICDPTTGYVRKLYDKFVQCAGAAPTQDFKQRSLTIGFPLTAADVSAICYGTHQVYLDDGTIALGDATAFAACDTYLAALTCDNWAPANPCTALFVGQTAASGTCFTLDSQVCAAGTFCDAAAAAVGPFCHECAAQKINGSGCSLDAECQSGHCLGLACVADPATVAPGGACDDDSQCTGVNFCLVQSDGSTKCGKNPTTATVGTKCAGRDNECASKTTGLFCKDTAGPGLSPTYTCQPFAASGATCSAAIDGDHCNPFNGQECLPAAGGGTKCQAAMLGAVGDACSNGNPCGAGLGCARTGFTTQGVCKTILPTGGNCDAANTICAPGADCVLQQPTGSACEYTHRQPMCMAN